MEQRAKPGLTPIRKRTKKREKKCVSTNEDTDDESGHCVVRQSRKKTRSLPQGQEVKISPALTESEDESDIINFCEEKRKSNLKNEEKMRNVNVEEQVKIQGSNDEMLAAAAEQFGSKSVDEIYKDRKSFSTKVFEVASQDLVNMGISVISYTLKDVKDDVGYLASLDKARTAQVQRDATIGEAETKIESTISGAKAKEQEIEAKLINDTEIARAKRDFELKRAAYDTEVNTANAEAQMAYSIQAAKFMEDEMQVKVVERAQQIEIAEQEIMRNETLLDYTVRKPAEVEKFRLEKMILESSAEAIALKGEAEAYATEVKAKAEAEQMAKNGEACKEYQDGALVDMTLQVLPKVAAEVSAPIAQTKEITMISDDISNTDMSLMTCKVKFQEFLVKFDDDDPHVDKMIGARDKGPTYMQQLEEIGTNENPVLYVNSRHIEKFDIDLYNQFICYPLEVNSRLDMAVNELFFERFPNIILTRQIKVFLYSPDKKRTLGKHDFDKLINVAGIVTLVKDVSPKIAEVIPEIVEAVFKCPTCHYTVTAELEKERVHETPVCQQCSNKRSLTLVYNRSRIKDKLMLKLQESPDDIPNGQTPRGITMYVHAELNVQPGDQVNVTGIYRALPMCNSPIIHNTFIDVVHIRKKPGSPLKTQFDGNQTQSLLLQFGHFECEDGFGFDVPDFFQIPQLDGNGDDPVVQNLAQEPRGQPLPINRQIKPKSVKDNHFYEVKRVFFIKNEMMVELDITFFAVAGDPERHLKKHNVVIPYEDIENLKIKNALQNRLVGKAIFIKDICKYTRQLLADIQIKDENTEKTGVNVTESLRFESPSLFVVNDIVYYCSGVDSLWRLTRPTKKLDEAERKKLSFVVFYSGESKEFVDSEETMVRGIFHIVEWFNKQQPNTRDHGWIWVYMARVVQGKLYLPLVKRYPQTTTVTTSGKQTRCAKSLAGSTFNLISNGKDEKGGKFREAQVFKKIIAGEEYIVDEMTEIPPAMKRDFVAVVQHNFQRLYRAVGTGGFPNAVMFVHCNIEPNDFNFDESDRSKMCFIDVGRTQTGQVKGEKERPKDLHKKIISTAENLHPHYPNLLAIGVECFFDPITDEEMQSIQHIVQDDDRKGQDVINALKFINKMKDLAEQYNIDLPNSLKSNPDIRCITEAFTRKKNVEDLLNWIDDRDLLEDCELATCNEVEGVRIPAFAVVLNDAPGDLQPVISACPNPVKGGQRWRFVAFHELTAGMVERVKMATLSICSLWCEEAKRKRKEEKNFGKEIIAAAEGRVLHQDDVDEEDLDEDEAVSSTAGSSTAGSSTGGKGITCTVCGKICKSAKGVKIHMKIHKST